MDYLDVGTPLSNKHYLGQPEGEMYGLAHNKARFQPEVAVQLRPESGIPGLYLTGKVLLRLITVWRTRLGSDPRSPYS